MKKLLPEDILRREKTCFIAAWFPPSAQSDQSFRFPNEVSLDQWC